MAYRRQSPKQMQAASPVSVASSSAAPGSASAGPGSSVTPGLEPKPARSRPRMMRQYDLVERVRSYNPDTNEDLLNRAYVYAMKEHGSRTPASGRPFFYSPQEA